MEPYHVQHLKQQIEAQTHQLADMAAQLNRIEEFLAALVRGVNEPEATVLHPSFPAANQPEEGDQAQPESVETAQTTNETAPETPSETAGNTQTVGESRIGAA